MIAPNPSGLCQCGCGARTNICPTTSIRRQIERGMHERFRLGHHRRLVGAKPHIAPDGYWVVPTTSRPAYGGNLLGRLRGHIAVVEKVLGHRLPPKAVIHHVNGVRSDNSHGNLVVCENTAYHRLLHARQNALETCGNPDFRRCYICGEWDHPDNQRKRAHPACWNRQRRERYASRIEPTMRQLK